MAGNQDSSAEALQGWRLDPAESHSDWEFEIASRGDDGAVVISAPYHTHKYVLSCGKRKSTYFESMFRGGFAETGTSSRRRRCRIELPALAADAVPLMLDYAYFPEKPLHIDTLLAAPLYFLSDYFGNDSMKKEVIDYVEKHLTLINCSIYLRQTKLVHKAVPTSDAIIRMVIQHCAKNLFYIGYTQYTTDEIIKEADVSFWLRVFENVPADKKSNVLEKHLNILIAKICDQNIDNITATEFHELTKEANIPWIDPFCANRFLMLQSTMLDKGKDEGGNELGSARLGDEGEDNKMSIDEDHIPLDWSSKLELFSHEEDDKDEDMDFTLLGEEERNLEEDEEWDAYSPDEVRLAIRSHPSELVHYSDDYITSMYKGFKDVPLYYDDGIEENELLNLKEEKIQQQEYDVDVYFDEGYDMDEKLKFTLRCIKSLCLNWEEVSGNLTYFQSRPEMLSQLYRGVVAVARKREQAWQLEKESLLQRKRN